MAYVDGSVRVEAAIIAGHSPEMDRAANRGLAIAKGLAAPHVDTGAYQRNLKVVTVPGRLGTGKRVSDRLIVADDPGAAAIESGYIRRIPGTRRVQFVPGQHILGKTVRLM